MRRGRALLVWTLALVLLAGGCPQSSDGPRIPGVTDTDTGSSSGTGSSGGSTQVAGGSGGTASSGCKTPSQAELWQNQVLQLVNQERLNNGLKIVTYNSVLATEAADYACELIDDKFFAHVNPVTGSSLADRAREAGYAYGTIGENLAAGQPDPAEVMADWMDSPDHRDNILNPAFTELGVAVRTGGEYGTYWVQEFGRPASAGAYTP